ncbi:MAG: hypothetical protein Q7J27_11895 [Syntrophales bacterium]|nr:hypothetical protein [Syntrophales bacterium]
MNSLSNWYCREYITSTAVYDDGFNIFTNQLIELGDGVFFDMAFKS